MIADPDLSPDQELATTPADRPRPLWRHHALPLVAGGAAIVLIVVAAIGLTRYFAGDSPSRLESAKEECAPDSRYITVGDGGMSLTILGAGAEERPGADFIEVLCVLGALDVSDAVLHQISGTRALDGRQHADWEGLTASWTYHPRSGLDLILQEER